MREEDGKPERKHKRRENKNLFSLVQMHLMNGNLFEVNKCSGPLGLNYKQISSYFFSMLDIYFT
jgi:hypothetical protein